MSNLIEAIYNLYTRKGGGVMDLPPHELDKKKHVTKLHIKGFPVK